MGSNVRRETALQLPLFLWNTEQRRPNMDYLESLTKIKESLTEIAGHVIPEKGVLRPARDEDGRVRPESETIPVAIPNGFELYIHGLELHASWSALRSNRLAHS